jgi:hypothetical protein
MCRLMAQNGMVAHFFPFTFPQNVITCSLHFFTRRRRFGNDGKWSTITVRLGNPVQAVFLLAGTGSSITTAVSSVWCNDPRSGYSCVDRGRQFDTSKSTTWQPIGLYGDLERPQLDEEYLKWTSLDLGYGAFGRDTVKIEDSQGRIVTLDNQTIAVVNDTTQLLGSLGLGLKTRSFKSDEAYPSFISVLANQSLIPSRSWGYTAGNYFGEITPQAGSRFFVMSASLIFRITNSHGLDIGWIEPWSLFTKQYFIPIGR